MAPERREIVGWAGRTVAAWLRVSGADGATFLQGQFSNDLRVPERHVVYGLWLNLKGKVLGDAWIWREAGETWTVMSFGSAAGELRERLERHIIADDVLVEDATAAWAGVTVVGGIAGAVPPTENGSGVPATEAAAVIPAEGAGWWIASRWVPGAVEWLFPAQEEERVLGWLRERGARALTSETLELARLAAGVPAVPGDLGAGDLPQEGGIEGAAVSFTKGCYVGQEVMARLHAMGQVRRRLVPLGGAGDPPPHGAALWQGGREVGTVRSTAREGADAWLGLGMLSLVHARPGPLSRRADAPPDIAWRQDERA